VKQGSQAGFGIKDGEPFESNWDGDLNWLKPRFHTQDLSVRFVALADRKSSMFAGAHVWCVS
jgi:hypothetical protein